MLILGIETSCDDTSAAVVEDGKIIRSNIIASQDALHLRFGGVVPEIACRAHLDSIIPVINSALTDAGVNLKDLDAIAATNTPGLIGALLIGLTAAKSIAWVLDVPLVAVNHLHGHIYASHLEHENIQYPVVSLIVSGGHTTLFLTQDVTNHILLGSTIDDAAGEAFDKVAKLLELGYPGGPYIDNVARTGNPDAVPFPRAYIEKDSLDFSFSGLKTSVLYHCYGKDMQTHRRFSTQDVADLAASFQEAVIDVLIDKTLLALEKNKAKGIIIGGGVAANSRLRYKLQEAASARSVPFYYPSLRLCTDNAAMVAGLAYHKYLKKDFASL
ncbi:MAG: tRNA (adenosine(37)-N6)-threonylcarbamoyltransferase complex transferase subunit TsaD, partial [Planctomycetes bacterium]|nr:tRNA (adenosine(37)-N6)-threonylcarbamoyltransferase complex transferase subunit TsaD [Planctomycetota bacterium]